MRTSPPLRGRLLPRLRELLAAGTLASYPAWLGQFLDGCERVQAGDLAGAAKAWRPLLNNDDQTLMPVFVFDAIGDTEVASRLDRADIDWYDQVTVAAHAREARRAHERGDHEAARRLAERVIAAWATADIAVPAVDDMRDIVKAR